MPSCGVGTTLASLPVKRGYFRLNALSLDVRRCPDAATNCDDAPECPESTSGCRGTVARGPRHVATSHVDSAELHAERPTLAALAALAALATIER